MWKSISNSKRSFMSRCGILGAGAVLGLVAPIGQALAQSGYPDKVIKLVVPYPPGGMSDTSSRAVASRLAKELGQQIIIENKSGAASTLASNWYARQPADGYTLYAGPVSMVVNPLLQSTTTYNPRKDFAPVSMMIHSPFVLQVSNSLSVSNMKDLLTLIRANPDKYAIGTSGVGAINHLAAEYFIKTFGLKLTTVHYKGGAPAAQDLMGGQIHMMFSAANEAAPMIQGQRTKGIAVTTAHRLPLLPDVPTVDEATGSKGFEAVFWMSLVARAGTPQPVLDKLQAAMVRVGNDDELRNLLARQGVELKTSTPDEVLKYMDRDEAKWGAIIRELGIKEN